MKKFEYKTFNHRLSDEVLNELGEDGWELVSHSAAANERSMSQYYIFKREL